MKKLYLSRDDRKLGGVCGGLGEMLGVDPNIVRILAIPLVLFTGLVPLLVTYFAAWVLLPERPALLGAGLHPEDELERMAAQESAA